MTATVVMSSQSSETTSFSRWFCSLGSALGDTRGGEETPLVTPPVWLSQRHCREWEHSLAVQDREVLLGQLVVLQLAHLGLLGHGKWEGLGGVVEVVSSCNEEVVSRPPSQLGDNSCEGPHHIPLAQQGP